MADRLIQLTVTDRNFSLTEDLEEKLVKVGDGNTARIGENEERTIIVLRDSDREEVATHVLAPGGLIDGVKLTEAPLRTEYVLFQFAGQV